MHASDALRKRRKYSNFDGLSFWLQNGYLLKLILLVKEKFEAVERVGRIYCICKIFNFRKLLTANCAWLWYCMWSRKTYTKGIEFPYHLNWISQNAPPLKSLRVESINLIKSDFITGNLNPCWMKFSWRRTSRQRKRF